MGRKSKSEERQKEILAAFYQTVQEVGIEKASIARIAKKMDVNPSLIIHYFKNKEEMEYAMVDKLLIKFQGDFLPAVEELETTTDKLKLTIFGIFSLEWLHKVDPAVFYSFYIGIFRNEELRGKFQVMYDTFANYLEKLLEQAKEESIIPAHIQPREFARMLVSLQEGNTYYQFLMKGKVNGRALAEHHVAMLYKMLNLQ